MKIKIGNKILQEGNALIVAELSANHNHSLALAKKTILSMKKAGADAVKIQTYTADTLTINCDNKFFCVKTGGPWDKRTLYDLYQEAHTPWKWQPALKKYAEDLGLVFFSSPFDFSAVDFLMKMKVPAFKIASFEITDHALIKYIAKQKKPVIISTGVATQKEITEAVEICRSQGNSQIILLKCTSAYPAPLDEMNLRTLPDLKKRFKTTVGLSDHSLGAEAAITAVALGALMIEKHFILSRNQGGPDAAFSMQPEEFKQMVASIRNAERALGKVTYKPSVHSLKSRQLCRSLFAVEFIKKGEAFTNKNVRSIRPSYGMHPKFLEKILGKCASRDIKRGTPLKINLIK